MTRTLGCVWLGFLLVASLANAADPAYTAEVQKWRQEFVAYEQPQEVRIPMTHIEWQQPMKSTGDVIFTLAGQSMRLKSFIDDNELFIMFTDQSNGTETYGGGRFVHAPLPKDGATVIDFNEAFNPYCSLNDYVMCPIPPPENRVELRVTAGEKFTQHE